MQDETIGSLVRRMEEDDRDGTTTKSRYVSFNMREKLDRIDAYLNSKHISGETDSKGRDKPFFNIVTAACNIWYRATDIDRKNIRLKATKSSDMLLSFLATLLVQQWMRKINFGAFLNEWGRVLSRYGSAVVKFVEKNGMLYCEVLPWDKIIIDPVDFENNIKIERMYYTPAQLLAKKEYDQKVVKELIEQLEVRETPDGQKKDNKQDYIEVFEARGELPLSFITGMEEDKDEYVQQMHVLSYLVNKEASNGKDIPQYDDFCLYSGREAKDPLMITHLIKEDGQSLSIGAVEHLFEAQWMQNHSVKAIKDQLDLSSKLIYQTSDGNFVGQNALTDIENGDILTWSPQNGGSRLEQVNNGSHDIGSLQAFQNQWKALGMEINGINEAMTTAPKAGTAWRQTEAALQEAHSLFELMTENKGLDIEEMMRRHILPWVMKKIDTTEEISEILDEYQLNKIDSMFLPAEVNRRVNKKIIDAVLNGKEFTPEEQQEEQLLQQQEVQSGLNTMGNQRFVKPSEIVGKTWKQTLEDFVWEVEVDVTGEAKDTQAVMSTLSTLLTFFVNKQGQPLTAKEKLITNKIMEETGAVSAMEINGAIDIPVAQPQQQQPQPQAQF